MVTGVRAVINLDQPNWRRRCEDAAAALRALLALPDDRPGSWEAGHVGALENELRDVVQVLDGGDE